MRLESWKDQADKEVIGARGEILESTIGGLFLNEPISSAGSEALCNFGKADKLVPGELDAAGFDRFREAATDKSQGGCGSIAFGLE